MGCRVTRYCHGMCDVKLTHHCTVHPTTTSTRYMRCKLTPAHGTSYYYVHNFHTSNPMPRQPSPPAPANSWSCGNSTAFRQISSWTLWLSAAAVAWAAASAWAAAAWASPRLRPPLQLPPAHSLQSRQVTAKVSRAPAHVERTRREHSCHCQCVNCPGSVRLVCCFAPTHSKLPTNLLTLPTTLCNEWTSRIIRVQGTCVGRVGK